MSASIATYTCPRCGDQSTSAVDCSECGAPMDAPPPATAATFRAVPAAAGTGTVGTAGTHSTGSVTALRQSQVVRLGGYTGVTGRVTGARRPSASTANFGTGTQGTRAGSHGTRHRGSRGSSSRRNKLGGGRVQMPVVPSQDPLSKLMTDPTVPESKCFCPNCKQPVKPSKRYCSQCGTEYSFQPKLSRGDIVAGQYEVAGVMAFGGLGWIYLARDKKVNDRWVVLKGLLNTRDAGSAAAAVAERQFLAAIKHGKIVGIYNFVTHGEESYIVMEYVGGRTLKDIRKETGPLPAAQAVAYILGILPAFQYLHDQKLVYCDFSPDNVMLEGEDVKLIDLGATRRIADPNGDIFGKPGYMAPEAGYDPYEPSDIFTIGRTLATLVTDMSMSLTGPLTWTVPDESFVNKGVKLEAVSRWSARLEGGDPLPNWLKFDASSRTFTGKAPHGILKVAVEVTALDASGSTVPDKDGHPATIPFDVFLPLVLPEPQDIRFDVPLAPFAKQKVRTAGTALTWAAASADGQPLPGWLKFDARKGVFSGRAPDGATRVDVQVRATDDQGASATVPFTIHLPFAESESLYRLLLKATAYDPDARFQSADEMAAQLLGVLCEMTAGTNQIPAAEDPEFLRERALPGTDPALIDNAWRRLPDLQIDDDDSAKSEVFSAGGTSDTELRIDVLEQATKKKQDSSEARLRLAAILIEGEQPSEERIMKLLDQAAAIDQFDWRPDWYCGLMRLALGQAVEAVECFDRVYGEVPGSLAPKLALAIALEMAGRHVEAAGLYDTVSATEPSMTAAAFGLARCRMAGGDREGAVDAYGRVPPGAATSSDAQLATALVLADSSKAPTTADNLIRAAGILSSLHREDIPRFVTQVAVVLEGVELIRKGGVQKGAKLFGKPFTEKELRLIAEGAMRSCARVAHTKAERIAYVDMANGIRPRTTW